MNTTIPDLWPKDLQPSTAEPAPAKILRQQAYALGQRTRNFVVGKVQTSGGERGSDFSHRFFVAAPVLNFEEMVLLVRHAATKPYPATIAVVDSNQALQSQVEAPDSQDFMVALQGMFAEKRFTDLIGSLLAQSDDPAED